MAQANDSQTASENHQPTLTRKQKLIRESKSIFLIVIVILFVRSVIIEPYRIPSGSMIPTLMIGDFILVNKFAYGFKVPFSDVFSDPIYLVGKRSPKRGDIIVFKFPGDPNINYIKRVMAIPGDTIEIRDKIVYINNKALPMEEIQGATYLNDMDEVLRANNWKFYKTQSGEHQHAVQVCADNYFKTDFEKMTIPAGQFFVVGDNRDYSYDSRFWGLVPEQNIKGEAILVWFSGTFPFLNDQKFQVNPSRIGTILQ